jgi:hypothetical protein
VYARQWLATVAGVQPRVQILFVKRPQIGIDDAVPVPHDLMLACVHGIRQQSVPSWTQTMSWCCRALNLHEFAFSARSATEHNESRTVATGSNG